MRHLNPMKDTTGLSYKDQYHTFDEDKQRELQERCNTQKWVGVCDVVFQGYGRGLISLQKIQKDDIIVDYHGKTIKNKNFDDYIKLSGNSEYCLEIKDSQKRIIDATSAECPVAAHGSTRCLGRLGNHGRAKKGKANMVFVNIHLKDMPEAPHTVVLKATKSIDPFTHLLVDYNCPAAWGLFD